MNDSKSVSFAPSNTLSNGVEYTLNVRPNIRDLSGKNLTIYSRTFVNSAEDKILKDKEEQWAHKESRVQNTYLFHGRTFDPISGLYYYRARYLHPELGRFIHQDPMGYQDSMNLYQAFNQNPVNFVDPFGMFHGYYERKIWTNSVLTLIRGKRYAAEYKESIELGKKAILNWIKADWKKFKSEVKSWFEDPVNFVEYVAWWLEDYGIYVPGLGAGTKMGTAATGTTVTGYRIDEVERTNRLLWGGFEFAFIWSGAATEPKPVTFRNRPLTSQNKSVVKYNPLKKGPLADDIAQTFRSATYSEITLDKPTTVYRVIGPNGNPAGSYWTRTTPKGPIQSIIDSALKPEWGNTAVYRVRAILPAGTKIYEGVAAAQGGLVGGGNQIFIPKVDPSWIQIIQGF
jgi:RHS repeat-associated protein